MSARNMIIMAPAQAAQALVGVGAVVVFTRLMSPEQFGIYALLVSSAALAHTLALTWVESAAFRFLPQAQREGATPTHFATMLGLSGIAAAICGMVLFVAILATPSSGWTAAAIGFAAAASAGRTFTKLARETDRAEQRPVRYAVRETAFVFGGFALGVGILVLTPTGPAAPFIGACVAGLIAAAFDAPNLIKRAEGGTFERPRVRTYAAYGLPLAAALALDLVIQTTTRATLVAFSGEAAAGAYAAAAGVTGRAIDIIFVWTALAFAPALLRAFEDGDKPAFAHASAALARGLFALAAPAAVGLCLVAHPLNALIIGEALVQPATLLAPYVATAALANGLATYLAAECFVLSRRTNVRTLIVLPVAILHGVFCVVLISACGVIGAGIASVLTAIVALAALAIIGARLAPLTLPWLDLGKCAVGCAVMATVVAVLPSPGGWAELTIKAATGALTYAGVLIALDMGGLRNWSLAMIKRAPA